MIFCVFAHIWHFYSKCQEVISPSPVCVCDSHRTHTVECHSSWCGSAGDGGSDGRRQTVRSCSQQAQTRLRPEEYWGMSITAVWLNMCVRNALTWLGPSLLERGTYWRASFLNKCSMTSSWRHDGGRDIDSWPQGSSFFRAFESEMMSSRVLLREEKQWNVVIICSRFIYSCFSI